MAVSPVALARLARAAVVIAREGGFALVDASPLPALPRTAVRLARTIERRGASDRDRAARLTAALNALGPSYVKLGQFLATRPDIVGAEVAAALGALRDEIPPFPESEARAAVAAAFGRPVEAVFAAFSPPVAAASIAQVHKAVVIDNGVRRDVAVKILRPNIEKQF
jgi:ubiquinone biosynthesis protein